MELRADVAALLERWVAERDPNDPLFPSERVNPVTGRKAPMSRNAVYQVVKVLLRRAKLNEKYNVHTLRHSYIAFEVEAQDRLGEWTPS